MQHELMLSGTLFFLPVRELQVGHLACGVCIGAPLSLLLWTDGMGDQHKITGPQHWMCRDVYVGTSQATDEESVLEFTF